MLAYEERLRIERRALEISALIESFAGKRSAELLPSEPGWYVLLIFPGMERAAITDLQRRSFAIYDPMFDEKYLFKGKQRTKRSRLLPGYLLCFVWDIEAHRDRLRACNGVMDILRHAGTDTPVVVPDNLIERFQGLEISRLPDVISACQEAYTDAVKARAKTGKRPRSAWKDRRDGFADAGTIDCISTKSYIDRITDLAGPERISLFNSAIGLPS